MPKVNTLDENSKNISASRLAEEFGDSDGVFKVSEYRFKTFNRSDSLADSPTWDQNSFSELGNFYLTPEANVITAAATTTWDPPAAIINELENEFGASRVFYGVHETGGLIPGSTITFTVKPHSVNQGEVESAARWFWFDNWSGDILAANGDFVNFSPDMGPFSQPTQSPKWKPRNNILNTPSEYGATEEGLGALNFMANKNLTSASGGTYDEDGFLSNGFPVGKSEDWVASGTNISITVPIIKWDIILNENWMSTEDVGTLGNKRFSFPAIWFVVAKGQDADNDIEESNFDDVYWWGKINAYHSPKKPTITVTASAPNVTGAIEGGETFNMQVTDASAKARYTNISQTYQWEIVDDPSNLLDDVIYTGTFTSTQSQYVNQNVVSPAYTPSSGDYWQAQIRLKVTDGIEEVYSDTKTLHFKRPPKSLEYINYNNSYVYYRNNTTSASSEYNPNLSGKVQSGDLCVIACNWTLPNTSQYGGLNGQTISAGRPQGIPNIISNNGFSNLIRDGLIHSSSYISGKDDRYYTPMYCGYQRNASTGANEPGMMAAFYKICDGSEGEIDLWDDSFGLRNEETQVWVFRGGSGGQTIAGAKTVAGGSAYLQQSIRTGTSPYTKATKYIYGNPSNEIFHEVLPSGSVDQANTIGRNGATLIFHFFTTVDPYFPSNHTSSTASNDYYGFHVIDSISISQNSRSTGNDVRGYGRAFHSNKYPNGLVSTINGLRFSVGIRQMSGDKTDRYDGVFYPNTNYSNNRWDVWTGNIYRKKIEMSMNVSLDNGQSWNSTDPHSAGYSVLNVWSYDPLYP